MISEIINRDTLISDVFEGKIICDGILVPMSIYNAMNSGFAYDIALNFPIVKECENKTPFGDKRKYGTIAIVNDNFISFILCYIHNGGYSKKDGEFVDYEHLKKCLSEINSKYKGKKIVSPIIGGSKFDGNGNKEKILSLFNEECPDVDICIYDFEQEDRKLLYFRKIAELRKNVLDRKISPEKYNDERRKVEWERKNGWIKEMPEDYVFIRKKNKG